MKISPGQHFQFWRMKSGSSLLRPLAGRINIFSLLMMVVLVVMMAWVDSAIRRLSVTYDEPVHIAGGYAVWRWGDYHFQGLDHPPLGEMISSAFLAFKTRLHEPLVDPQDSVYRNHWIYDVGDALLYQSYLPVEFILRSCRWSGFLVFAPILIVMVWLYAKKLSSGAQYWAILLLFFEPNLLAHAALATKDYASAVLILASVFFWCLFLERPTEMKAFALGVFVSAAMLLKYTNLVIWPILAILGGLHYRQWTWTHAKRVSMAAVAAFLVFLLCYQSLDWHVYVEGVYSTWRRASGGRWSFFIGEHSKIGWLTYFPVAFLVKTNLCHLFLGGFGLGLVIWRLRHHSIREIPLTVVALLLVPPVVFLMAMVSKVQIGHRHILALYPFLVLFGAAAANYWVKSNSVLQRWALFGCLGFGFASTARISPYFLSYFNEGAGGARRGYRILTDSNVDWGQGLGDLSIYLKKNNLGPIYLSYFGSADPTAHGIDYVPIGFVSNMVRTGYALDSPALLSKVILAVSVTNLQGTYYAKKDAFRFLENCQPLTLIAYSIFVYDLTNNRDALLNLADLFEGAGNAEEAQLLRRRSREF